MSTFLTTSFELFPGRLPPITKYPGIFGIRILFWKVSTAQFYWTINGTWIINIALWTHISAGKKEKEINSLKKKKKNFVMESSPSAILGQGTCLPSRLYHISKETHKSTKYRSISRNLSNLTTRCEIPELKSSLYIALWILFMQIRINLPGLSNAKSIFVER